MTVNFSLTHPEPIAGRDTNVFAAVPGRSYEEVAGTSWLEVQHGALDMDDLDEALIELATRLDRGDAWLKANDRSNARYLEAIELRNELENRRRSLLVQMRCAAYACWIHCCELYSALQYVDRQAWIQHNARRRFTGDSPQGIWHAVRGKQPPPGAWPQEHTELWIERRLGHVEIWNMDMLRDRLHDRQEAEVAR